MIAFRASAERIAAGLGAVCVGIAASLLLVQAPVAAQDMPDGINAPEVIADVNGLNLLNGKGLVPRPSISIPAAPRLQFSQASDFFFLVEGSRLSSGNRDPNPPPGSATGGFVVNYGGLKSESFECSGRICSNRGSDNSALTILTDRIRYDRAQSGEIFRFDLKLYEIEWQDGQTMQYVTDSAYYATSVEYPDGEVLTLQYQAFDPANPQTNYRPIKITSNTGYALELTYWDESGPNGWNRVKKARIYATLDPAATLAQLSYSQNGTSVTDLANQTWSCSIDCGNYLETTYWKSTDAVVAPGATSPELEYVGNPSHTSLTEKVKRGGRTWTYTYSGFAEAINPFNGVRSFKYDTVTLTDPAGKTRNYQIQTFDGGASYGGKLRYRNDYVKSFTDENGRTIQYAHEQFARYSFRVKQITYPEGNSEVYTYSAWGNITKLEQKAKPGSSFADLVMEAGYPSTCAGVACYRPIWVRDANLKQTDFLFNAAGQLVEKIRPADASGARLKEVHQYETGTFSRESVSYTCALVDTQCGSVNGVRKEISYWGNTFLPQSIKEIDQLTGEIRETAYSYDAAGRVIAIDGPQPGTADTNYTRFDAVGRQVGTISADPDGGGPLPRLATRTTYDARGHPVLVEQGSIPTAVSEATAPKDWGSAFTVSSSTQTSFDALGRKLTEKVIGSDGLTKQLTQYSYDAAGRLECTAVRMNPAVYGSLPASACTLGTQGSDGPDRITRMVYDAAGQVVQVRKAVGTSIESVDVTNSYTANGKLEYVIDANGNRARLEYDGFDRQVKWIFPSTTRPSAYNASTQATALTSAGSLNTGDYEQYTYDANGNRLTLRKRDGTVLSYQYDALNRMTAKIVPERAGLDPANTRDVFYGYDLRGLQTYALFGSRITGAGITYAYDGFGRLVSETQNTDGVTRTVSSQYDLNGNRTRVTHPDGQYFQFDYDGLDRLTTVRQGTTVLGNASYNTRGLPTELAWSYLTASANKRSFGYDTIGRLSSLGFDLNGTSNDVSWSYARNPASQITSETQSNDAYSWNGYVALSRAYATNGLNQYTAAGGASFCYDANGNLTADGTSVYLYDIENRLVEKREQGAGNTNCAALSYAGTLQVRLRYDPTGRLYDVAGGALGPQRFIYDGNALVVEYNSVDTVRRRYVHGSNVEADDPLIVYEGSAVSDAARRYLHADPRGSIVAVTNYQGTSLYTNTYDEYGIPDTASGNDIATKGRFRYTGQAWIPELGMYYYKARIYSPTLGRFLQTDPIGYEDQFNLYAYVANDPINGTDPTGTEIKFPDDEVEAATFVAVMATIVEADPELGARYEELRLSENVHELRMPSPGEAPHNSTTGIQANESNGIGTGSITVVDPLATINTTNTDGSVVANSGQAVTAHEFLGHGIDKDRGTIDRSINPASGIRRSEESAMKVENLYKDAVGEKKRDRY